MSTMNTFSIEIPEAELQAIKAAIRQPLKPP